MNDSLLGLYRDRPLDLRTALRDGIRRFATTTDPVAPDRAIGRLTRMDALQSQQMAIEMKRRNEAQLRLIDQALERIEDRSYGICLKCEEPISPKRLEVHPETPVCIACAR